jgi:primosomal protein N' (replication factor Y)
MSPNDQSRRYARVAFELRLGKKLEYEVPEDLRSTVHVGCKVRVPLGKQKQVGYIAGFVDKPSFSPLKKILGLVESELKIPDNVMELARWMSDYYCTDLGLTLRSVVPAAVRKDSAKFKYVTIVRRKVTIKQMREKCKELQTRSRVQARILEHMLEVEGGISLKDLCRTLGTTTPTVRKLVDAGLLTMDRVRRDRDLFAGDVFLHTEPKKLTEWQQAVFDVVVADLDGGKHSVHLIHGITSSGKTEIYLQLIRKVLDSGRSAIVLVPEISLTPQTIERFRSRFGDVISALHHRLSDGERHDEWHRLLEGKSRIAIGARSAVFAPVQRLALIVVDEEHEKSYKQADIEPTYNARDIAVVRGKTEGAVIVLGSATPSMESYYNAVRGKYVLSELPERIDNMPLPSMKVVDMTKGSSGGGQSILSDVMVNAIEKRLELGEQVMLFLNRRGYATTLVCRGCREVMTCTNCSIPLKFHKAENRLLCHMCGYTTAVPRTCPLCRAETVLQRGFGTEKVERMLYKIFPEKTTVLRMDADTTRKKRSHDEILREFKSGRANILVGTQMIAKGLHFPNVTLVGIVNADTSLYMQDFRASENAYQLITQVSGRAGRGEVVGEVIVQTSMPDHFAIRAACHHSYREFFEKEIESRRVFGYPPLIRMVAVNVKGSKEDSVRKATEDIRKDMDEEQHPGIRILGPVEAVIRKAKGDFRYQIFLKSTRVSAMTHLVSRVLSRTRLPTEVRASTDVDPVDTL